MSRPVSANRVLLVDDDESYTTALRDLLTSRGYEVAIATAPDAMLQLLASFSPPVVLMDVRLGRASGLDLLARLVAERPDVHCIMMTARADTTDAIAAMRLGAYDYYEKSSYPADLYAILRRAFERHQFLCARAQAEAKLREQKLHLDTALQYMSQALCMYDAEGRLVFCNERYLQLYRLTAEVAKPGVSVCELLKARHKAGTFVGDPEQRAAEAIAENTQGKAVDYVQEFPDGRSIRTVRQPMAGGGWVSTQEDVTEQRLLEKERDLSQTLLNTVVENIPDTIVVKDARDLRYVLVNRAAESMHGVLRDEIIGKTAYDLFSRGEADAITAHDREVVEWGGQIAVDEHPHQTMRNGMRTVSSKKIVIPDEHGKQKYLLGVIEDVTEQRRAETAERRNAEVLTATITSMADAVLVLDEDGKVLIANPAAVRLFGDRADVGSDDWKKSYQVLRADSVTPLPSAEAPIARAIHGEAFDDVRMILRNAGSTEFTSLIVNGRPLRDAGGALKGAVVVYRDVTKVQATKQQLRQAQKMDAIGQLTGGVAHDFNNILTVITGTIEILTESLADRPKLAAIAKMIDAAAERGSELTKQLLAFARKQPLRPRQINVNGLILDVAKLLRPTLGAQIEIDSTLNQDCWPALVDPSQLTTALLNLAVNARDAMPQGGKLTLETENVEIDEAGAKAYGEATPGSYVMIAVSDTGSGIPASIRDKVFEPFFTTKGVGNGTGLGLSMVYGFVKQSGGQIRIYSEEGQGTAIKIYLPRSEGVAQPAEKRSIEPLTGGKETILVVEDDDPVLINVTRQLQALGYTTLTARNAEEALVLTENGAAFDLLFTDVIMPGVMNGSQLAELVNQRRPGTKVLFTSGYIENASQDGGLRDGGLLLPKPYRKADLARTIRQALDSDRDAPSLAPTLETELAHAHAAGI
jgi:PAS domain S-box-containing protein